MSAFLKIEGIEGAAEAKGYEKWIKLESVSYPVLRAIQSGVRGADRCRGTTTVGDVSVNRHVDKSSVKIAEACAAGKYFEKATIHLCNQYDKKQEPYLKLELSHVIITSYSFHGFGEGSSPPSEDVTMGYTKIDWTYIVLDPDTGKNKGEVPAMYDHEE
jgi:type VI secretion system Hcp family effector